MTEKDQRDEAQRILDRVARESESVGTSSMARVAEKMKNHLNPEPVSENEWAEKWGTRIGRSAGILFAIFLMFYLVNTYVFKG